MENSIETLNDELVLDLANGAPKRQSKVDKLLGVLAEGNYLLLRHFARSIAEGVTMGLIRKSFESRLNDEKYEWLLDKHGLEKRGSPPKLKINHPEFLSSIKNALAGKAPGMPADSIFHKALERLSESSGKAMASVAKRKAKRIQEKRESRESSDRA